MNKFALLLTVFITPFLLRSQSLERVEPPFWWAGMKNPTLQLMIYGEQISDLTPSIKNELIEIIKVHQAKNPNYIFIDLHLKKSLPSGIVTIEFKKGKQTKISHDYEFKKREEGSADRKGIDASDVVYLITPDRFANGDKKNDVVEGLREGHDRSLEYGRHGGDIQGIVDHLPYLKDLGFSTIWLNPVLINDQDKWSYHGYATTDYYQVDPRFGTNESYTTLAKKAKEMGIGMIMDIIVNHCGSFHWWIEDPPFDDWINNQSGEYLGTNHRKETLLDPYKSESDRQIMTEGWFVPAMPDLNQRNPFMSTYLIQNSIWWIEYAHLAGIRQDTYSYPFRQFMTDWTCAIKNEYPNFYIVGEEWIEDPAVIAYWQENKVNQDGYTSCLPGVMDFPLCFAVHEALNEDEDWKTGLIKIYQTLSRDFHYAHPDQLITFPDNHDMSRIFTQVNEDFNLYKIALGFLLTTRGIPQIYYGTEIAMHNRGTESHGIIRSDFPGGWPGDIVSVKNNIGLDSLQSAALAYCKKIINWRNDKKVIHQGKLIHYVPENGMYVYFRILDDETVMVILNKNRENSSLELTRFANQLDGYSSAKNVIDDNVIGLSDYLQLPDRSITILELRK